MLEVKDITFSFDKKEKKPLIKNLSFKVNKGEILFISGKSGLGKSTLLDLISGFHDNNLIWTGKIYLNKLDITNISIQNKRIGYMLQDYFLFPHFNVKNNLIFSLPKQTRNKKEQALDYLKQINMVEFSNHYPSELSGGQKARIACLRAIISNPDALLLDEPFSSLDKKTMKSFQKFLFDFVIKLNIPCIIVSHRLVKNLNNSIELNITKFT
ncbi:MAG: ABC transporter ATP-binding protein [Alphaproteobacteria bacterium]|nr:MAG: ABC transporter ATP-binding protein [Alphaproteobacteria bacterium]